jgi:2-amino-4-hydroxy-6-hydroxymethyldihydropteridine diphosphokinase
VTTTDAPRRAAFGLGSNLGNRQRYLEKAVESLASHAEVVIVGVSSIYETEPVGGPEQGPFLNAVVVADVTATPEELLDFAQQCEREASRERLEHWGPRTLDVDVLAVEGVVMSTESLTLPHPLAAQRAFVLIPWTEVDPGFVLSPGLSVLDAARTIDAAGVRRSKLAWSVRH